MGDTDVTVYYNTHRLEALKTALKGNHRWRLFRKKNGTLAYNSTCLRCVHSCK